MRRHAGFFRERREGRRVLGDDRPGIVMDGDDPRCAEELRRFHCVCRAHGVVVPDGEHRVVDGRFPSDERHVAEERRVAGVVHVHAVRKADEEAAGHAARHAGAVERRHHVHPAEGQREAPAEIHGPRRLRRVLEEAQHLRHRDDRRARARCDGVRVTEVVPVRVGEQDVVAVHILRADGSAAVPREERIEEQLFPARVDQEARMAVKCEFHG